MVSERDLLLEIIQNTPNNSKWNISNDSWEKIPIVFPLQYLTKKDFEWEILIDDTNRINIISIIDKYELFDKIVHQNIISNGDIIFKSFDYMVGSYLSSTFPHFNEILNKYNELGLSVEFSVESYYP